MASFPPEPPFDPDAPPASPDLDVPYPPPLVGEGSPWAPADSENRDRILDWWRMWFRRVFFPWITAWIAYWAAQWQNLADYLNTWISAVDEYISEHAISGYSWRTTTTTLNTTVGASTTGVVFAGVDQEYRPLAAGDLVSDQSDAETYGIITAVTDTTHATVETLGHLQGPQGIQGIQGPKGDKGDQGEPGTNGADGVVQSIVAGSNVTVDSTDPANPVVSASGGGGSDNTFDTVALLAASTPTVGNTYYTRDAPGLQFLAVAGGKWETIGILRVGVVEDTYTILAPIGLNSQGNLYFQSAYSNVVYSMPWSSLDAPVPWDSDWIQTVPIPGAGTSGLTLASTGFFRFSNGAVVYRGHVEFSAEFTLGDPIVFQVDAGLRFAVGEALGDYFGDAVITLGGKRWRGYVTNTSTGYAFFIPDVAGSSNFDADTWAGLMSSSVNQAWTSDVIIEWTIVYGITNDPDNGWNDGRSTGDGDGTDGDPVGGGTAAASGDYPIYTAGSGAIALPANTDTNNTSVAVQPHVPLWIIKYGDPDATSPHITSGGARFNGVDPEIIAGTYDPGTGLVGAYVPVIGDKIAFEGLDPNLSGISENTWYYIISSGTATENAFNISETPGGSPVAWSVSVAYGYVTYSFVQVDGSGGPATFLRGLYTRATIYAVAASGYYFKYPLMNSVFWDLVAS